MQKRKRRDERKQILNTRIFPVVRFDTKSPLHPRYRSTQSRVLFPDNQVYSLNTITITLIPLSTKELHHEAEARESTVAPSCCMRTLLGCCVARRCRDPWRQRDRQEKKTSERIDHVRFRRKGKRVKHLSKYMYFSLPNWLGKFVFLPLPRKPIVFLPFFL